MRLFLRVQQLRNAALPLLIAAQEQSTVCDECGENLESATAIKEHFKVHHAGKEIITKNADDVRSNAKGRRNKSAPTKSLSS